MTINTNEPIIVLVNREFLVFKRYQVDVKVIKCLLQWWEKDESMVPTFGFSSRQIFGIIRFQIEIKTIFS
jgi:hypothetical protein